MGIVPFQPGRGRGGGYVRFGSKADMCGAKRHVCFAPNSGHVQRKERCPLVPEADIQRRFYSMPSSTGVSKVGGTVRPNSMVVLKLMTSSAQSGVYSHFFHLKNR